MAANLLRIRKARGLTTTALAEKLKELGHSIPASGLTRIEKGDRRVDVDDLVALADALNIAPADLLLPATAGDEQFSLTSEHAVTSRTAWEWMLGQRPAMDWHPGEGVNLAEPGASPAVAADAVEREEEFGRLRGEFMRLSLPRELRRTANHPLVQLAKQLEDLTVDIVGAPGDKSERIRWIRMAQRRIQQLNLNLEEFTEVLEKGDGADELVRLGIATRTVIGPE